MAKLKKFVYEMYNENSCPLNEYITPDKKMKRRDSKLQIVTKRHSDYTSENKRMLKSMFKIFDKNDFFVVKHLDVKKEKEKELEKERERKRENHEEGNSTINKGKFLLIFFS